MASKRVKGSPTGQTPNKPPKIRYVKTSKGNRKLDFDQAHDQESFIDEVVGAECCETVVRARLKRVATPANKSMCSVPMRW